jgi:hypothetical protein
MVVGEMIMGSGMGDDVSEELHRDLSQGRRGRFYGFLLVFPASHNAFNCYSYF